MKKLTASKLDLAKRCRHPFGPGVDWPEESGDRYATAGSAFHAYGAAVINRDDSADECERIMDQLSESDAAAVQAMCDGVELFIDSLPEPALAETAFAYDVEVDTARQLPGQGNRDYGACTESEVPGTIDVWWVELISRSSEAVAVVADWETGWSHYKGSARHSLQLGFYALCVARACGCTRARVEIWHVDDEGAVKKDVAELDELDMDAIAGEVKQLHEATQADAEPCPGTHCDGKFCPLLGSCPVAQKATSEALVVAGDESPEPYALPLIELQSPEHAASVLTRLKMVEAGCKHISAKLREYTAEHGPIPLDNGKVWGPRDINRDTIDTDKAMVVLAEYGDVDELVPRKATKTALKALPPKTRKLALGALKEAGALTSKTSVRFEVHRG